jgi:hypothetical protein
MCCVWRSILKCGIHFDAHQLYRIRNTLRRSLFFSLLVFCLSFLACRHKSDTAVRPDVTVIKSRGPVSYIFTDTFYSKDVMGTDSVIETFHAFINDTEKIIFDSGGKFILFRNQTFNIYNTSPGDTVYTGPGPGTDANLFYVSPDTVTFENISHLGHLYSWTSSLRGYKIH